MPNPRVWVARLLGSVKQRKETDVCIFLTFVRGIVMALNGSENSLVSRATVLMKCGHRRSQNAGCAD